MTTKFSSNSFISLVSYKKNLNCNALRAMLMMLLFVLGIGNAWAHGGKCTAKLSVAVGTGSGTVYAAKSSTAGSGSASVSADCGNSDSGTHTHTFYAFATPTTGYKFVGWTMSPTDATGADPTSPKTVSITSNSHATVEVKYYAHFAEKKSVNITFLGDVKGGYKYTIGGSTTTVSGGNATASDVEEVALSDPTPNPGYAFAGFYQIAEDGTLIDYGGESPTVTFSQSGTVTIGCRFVSTTLPKFVVKETGEEYYGLKSATAAAISGQTIVPTGNHTIDGSDLLGADNNTYTIPSGVTLLIPYDANYTLKTSEPSHSNTDKGATSLFRKLTLSNVVLNVNGSICVGGEQIYSAGGGSMSGYTDGKYGQLVVEENTIINLNSANLYCWGFITGGGHIYAYSGTNVFEPLQLDFRGGSYCADNYSTAFVANQYYVQNIETPITFYSGSVENVYTGIFINTGSIEVAKSAPFIASDGLFKLNSGASLTRRYDPTNDRQIYDIDGDAQLQGIEIELYKGFLMTVIFDSKAVILPLTNNMVINIHSGTTNIIYAAEMLADAKIVIDEGATLKAKSNIFIYDKDDYVGKKIGLNADINPVPYSPTKTGSRTSAKLADAKVEVNGILEMYVEGKAKGYLYTTPGGADICSSGNGVVRLASGAGTTKSFKENNGTASSLQDISVTPAKLHNASQWYTAPYTGDNACEYLATAGAAANTTITYANGHWGWIGIWKDYDGTILKVANTCLESQLAANAPADPTREGAGCTMYTFKEWTSSKNPTNQEIVYTATYDESTLTYEITYAKGSAANAAGSLAGGTKTCGVSYTLSSSSTAFTRTGYTYDGWSKNADGSTKDYELGGTYTANAAITLYPHWVLDAYTISYAAGTAEGAAGSLAGGTKTHDVSYTLSTNSTAFIRTGYTYDGWSINVDGSTKDYAFGAAYTANVARTFYPHWVINTYTLTLSVAQAGYGTTTSPSITSIPHGSAVTTNGDKITVNGTTVTATPAEATAQYTYAFSSWTNVPATVTTSATVTANFTRTTNQYTIVWKSEDGTSILETDADQPFGTSTAYNRATPTKDPTAQYTYTFDGWATEANGAKIYDIDGTPAVGGAATYYAHFNATVNNYTITWKNHDGSTLETDENVPYGTTPSYDGATPTKAADDDYTYTFADWSPAVASVTGDAAYTATFTLVLIPKGDRLDIVDVDNTAKTLTLNVAGWANAGWPYTINDDTYQKTARKADRTMIIPYAGEVGDEMTITVKDKLSAIKSKYTYVIPTEITASTSISSIGANNVLYVKNNATLTVDEDKAMGNIYIAPGAKLIVSAGKTLTADKVLLRTTPWQSAELENNGTITAQVYYTRIISSASQYYQFGLPRNCAISEVKLSDGSTPAYTTAWLLRSYSESTRAAEGANGGNWITLPDGGTIQGGVGYEMFSSSNYYREYYFPVSLNPATTSVGVSYTADGDAGSAHAGWNIICSPLTSRYSNTGVDPVQGLKVSWLQDDGSYNQEIPTTIPPAIPFSYQASSTGDALYFNEAPLAQHIAARRTNNSTTETEWIHIDIQNTKGKGDHTSLFAHPDRFEATYETGIDVAKQSLTASRAIIYSSHAYGEMAFAGVADTLLESGVALTVYSPVAQELTFSLRENIWLNRMESVWLIDKEEGMRIDLLNGYYTFNASEGTTRGRFFIQGQFKAPQVATDIQNGQSGEVQSTKARKLMINQKIFIEINGRLYDATGKEVKR